MKLVCDLVCLVLASSQVVSAVALKAAARVVVMPRAYRQGDKVLRGGGCERMGVWLLDLVQGSSAGGTLDAGAKIIFWYDVMVTVHKISKAPLCIPTSTPARSLCHRTNLRNNC